VALSRREIFPLSFSGRAEQEGTEASSRQGIERLSLSSARPDRVSLVDDRDQHLFAPRPSRRSPRSSDSHAPFPLFSPSLVPVHCGKQGDPRSSISLAGRHRRGFFFPSRHWRERAVRLRGIHLVMSFFFKRSVRGRGADGRPPFLLSRRPSKLGI